MSYSFPLLKLKRKLIKRYIKLTHPREQWYKADYWPDVKIYKKEITFQNQKINTHLFSSIEDINNDINILGSGPSINQLDYIKLSKSNYNIFLNGSVALAFMHNLPIYAYVIMDANFVYNRFDLISRIGKSNKLILSLGALCAIAERNIDIILLNNIYIFKQKKIDSATKFSDNVDSYVIDGGTVMSIAMQIFQHTKPNNVYLLGLDISNANAPRFYENHKNAQKSGLHKDYENKILPFMSEAAKQFKHNIFNCSPVSKVPFDIIPYSSKYKRKDSS